MNPIRTTARLALCLGVTALTAASPSLSPAQAQVGETKTVSAARNIAYSVYDSYYESNQSGLKGATSHLVVQSQAAFDKVFGAAALSGENRFLPENAFQKGSVLAVVKRGSSIWDYKVNDVSLQQNALTIRYEATARTPTSAMFASPLILAVNSKEFTSVAFVENGQQTHTAAVPLAIIRSALKPQQRLQALKIYLVALGDNGKQGRRFGCEDSLVAHRVQVPATNAPLTSAIRSLISWPEDSSGNPALHNYWKGEKLDIKTISVRNGVARIHLTGRVYVAGICDVPRITTQIEATAMQFPSVKKVLVFLNNVPLAEAIR
jgi:hypothetical protein